MHNYTDRYIKSLFALLLSVAVSLSAALTGCRQISDDTAQDSSSAGADTAPGSADKIQGGDAPVEDGLLRISYLNSESVLDFHKTNSDYLVTLNVFDRLLETDIDENGNASTFPSLAESFEISDDALRYSFTLKDNLRFSDGSPLTSEDVKFSFTRALSLSESGQIDCMNMIMGADKVIDGSSDSLEGIQVIDDRHFTITLRSPYENYEALLSTPGCSILSKKNVTEQGSAFGTTPESIVGSGPYRLTELSESGMLFEKNTNYWSDPPSAGKVQVYFQKPVVMNEAFRNGEIDLLDLDFIYDRNMLNEYKSDRYKDHISVSNSMNTYALTLNQSHPPLDDVRVRRAIQLAIDREEILADVFDNEGELMDGILPKGLYGYSQANQGWLKHDHEEAKRLLEEAGVKDDFTLELAISQTQTANERSIISSIRDQLLEVGINAKIVCYDNQSREALKKRGMLMANLVYWIADDNDPDNFFYSYFGSLEKLKSISICYENTSVINRVCLARSINEKDKRLEEYAYLERKLVKDDAVWVPLFSTRHRVIKGDRVADFKAHWSGWKDMCFKNITLR